LVVSLYHEGEKEPWEGLPPGVVGRKLTKSQLPEVIQVQIPQETYIGGFELEFSDWGAQISRIPALLSGFWKALGIVDSIRENGLATAIKEMAIEKGLKEISLENLSPSERDEIYIGGDIEKSGRDMVAKLKVGDPSYGKVISRF